MCGKNFSGQFRTFQDFLGHFRTFRNISGQFKTVWKKLLDSSVWGVIVGIFYESAFKCQHIWGRKLSTTLENLTSQLTASSGAYMATGRGNGVSPPAPPEFRGLLTKIRIKVDFDYTPGFCACTFFGYFHVFQVVGDSNSEYSKKMRLFQKNWKIQFLVEFCQFLPMLCIKNHVLKKVGRERSGDLFSIWCFLNLHALGYPKSVTKKFCTHFWVNKSLNLTLLPCMTLTAICMIRWWIPAIILLVKCHDSVNIIWKKMMMMMLCNFVS
jgi:hypothetical protein